MLIFKSGGGFPGAVEDDEGNTIATINTWSDQEQERYGRLFAAAPELLEGCIRALEELDRRDGPQAGPDDVRPLLKTAIEQATQKLNSR